MRWAIFHEGQRRFRTNFFLTRLTVDFFVYSHETARPILSDYLFEMA